MLFLSKQRKNLTFKRTIKNNNSTTYIPVISWDLGGTEVRFLDIFLAALKHHKQVVLIAPNVLIKKLVQTNKTLLRNKKNIIVLSCSSKNKVFIIYEFAKLLFKIPKNSKFHYPLNCLWPLHFWRNDKLSCSVVLGSYPNGRGLLKLVYDFFCFMFVSKIDVLNPDVFLKIKKIFKKKTYLTPNGSFILKPLELAKLQKTLNILLYGRFVHGKGIIEFIKNYEKIFFLVSSKVDQRIKLIIAGYGHQETTIKKYIKKIKTKKISITLKINPKINDLLRYRHILISNQTATNYPSRCVVESLTAGCPVLVKNSGDSKKFGQIEGLEYFGFSTKSLANKIVNMTNKWMTIQQAKKIRQNAIRKFSNDSDIVNYYFN